MKVLFLDTSSFFVTIAIVVDDKIEYLYHDSIRDDMSSKIIPIIDNAFKLLPFDVTDIDKIMVVNGPGSFTGVRIGVTIAKVLAMSIKKDIIPISSLEFLATTSFSTKYIIPMIDARRGYVYAGVYDKDLKNVLQDQYMPYTDLHQYISCGTIVSYDNLEGSIKPDVDVLTIIKKHIADKPISYHLIVPNYLKKTEAEEHLGDVKNDS